MSQQLVMKHGDKVTHSPYSGGVYFGSQSIADIDFNNPYELIGSRKLADLRPSETKQFKGSIEAGAGIGWHTVQSFEKKFTAVSTAHMQKVSAMKNLVAVIQEEGYSSKGYMAAMQLEKMKQMGAASQPGIQGVGQDAVDPIRVIQIITKIRGLRPNIYNAEQGFFTLNVNKLDARTPEQDIRKGQVQMRPMDKIDFDQLKYGEGRFSLKKNAHATLLPSEAMKRSDFNLEMLNMTDSMIGHARMRNGQALQALGTFSGAVGNTPSFQINDPEATGSSAIPHGAFNVKKELLAIIQSHAETYESILGVAWINPIDYARWESNYDVSGKDTPSSEVRVAGVIPMKGIPEVTAILDRGVPRGLMYLGDSQSCLKGVGPFETEFWKEYERDAHAFVTRDYVQFLVPNPGRYGIKVQIDGASADVFTPGTEIVTDEDLEDYVNKEKELLNAPVLS